MMDESWPAGTSSYDGTDNLDSSIHTSQFFDRDWTYPNENATCGQFPWFGCIPQTSQEISPTPENVIDCWHESDLELLGKQPPDNFNLWNSGDICNDGFSSSHCEFWQSHTATDMSSVLTADIHDSLTNLRPSAQLCTVPASIYPVSIHQYQLPSGHPPSSHTGELHWPDISFEPVSQEETHSEPWENAAQQSLCLERQLSTFSLSPEAPNHAQQLAMSLMRLVPRSIEDSTTEVRDGAANGCISSSAMPPNAQTAESQTVSKRPASFDACVNVFETTPGAMTKVKRRRKLDATSHKSFKVTRKIGACLECRFRKRPCNPGTPCEYCMKVFRSPRIAQITCRRESPFVGYEVTDYFLISSIKRIIDFDLKLSSFHKTGKQSYIIIDGRSGPCSLPLKIPIIWQQLESLPLEEQAEVWRTKQTQQIPISTNLLRQPASGYIAMIPENDEELGQRLESWAIRYSSKFSRDYYQRYPTAYMYNVGMKYVTKKLPEHELVALLLRSAALSYVLRAGVKCPASEFHTIQARIDTVLYRRLRAAESALFAALQKIVWVSAGRLKREQLYPVAFIIWQQMRSTCLRASHVVNLLSRAKGNSNKDFVTQVDKLRHCFNLLLSTHTALFRSNSPIIMDFTIPENQDLLAGDDELIREAIKLQKIILEFQKYNLSRPFKSSNWYIGYHYRRFREVLNGKGVV